MMQYSAAKDEIRTEPWEPVSDSASSNRLRCARRELLGRGTPGSGPPGTLGSPSTSRTPSGIAATRLELSRRKRQNGHPSHKALAEPAANISLPFKDRVDATC